MKSKSQTVVLGATELHQLQNYWSLSIGWLGTILHLLGLGLAGTALWQWDLLRRGITLTSVLCTGVIFLYAICLTQVGSPFSFFASYYRRNVRGYWTVWWLVQVGIPAKSEIMIQVLMSKKALREFGAAQKIAILLPLGGWFKKPKVFDGKEHYTAWRVVIDDWNSLYDGPNLVIADYNHSKMRLPISEMLRLLTQYPHELTWMHIFHAQLQSEQARLEAKSRLAELQRDHAFEKLLSLAVALSETSRIGQSRVGRALVVGIAQFLAQEAPKESPIWQGANTLLALKTEKNTSRTAVKAKTI